MIQWQIYTYWIHIQVLVQVVQHYFCTFQVFIKYIFRDQRPTFYQTKIRSEKYPEISYRYLHVYGIGSTRYLLQRNAYLYILKKTLQLAAAVVHTKSSSAVYIIHTYIVLHIIISFYKIVLLAPISFQETFSKNNLSPLCGQFRGGS